MRLFKLTYAEARPWAFRVESQNEARHVRCATCGLDEEVYSGPAKVEIEDGTRWTDLIGGDARGRSRLLISQRVLDEFQKAEITGIYTFPVEFLSISPVRLRS